jgi:hypothetical protein
MHIHIRLSNPISCAFYHNFVLRSMVDLQVLSARMVGKYELPPGQGGKYKN